MDGSRCICLLNDSFPPVIDGVSTAVVNYAEKIEENYGSAVVVTPKVPKADDSAFPFPVVRYPSIDLTRQTGYRAGMPFSPQLMRKLNKHDFDLIHSHCPIASTVLARLFRDQKHMPLILTYHTKFDEDIARAVRSEALRAAAAKMLVENVSACDEIWAVSRGAGENLRSLGYEGEYVVMPNGVDFPAGRVSDAEIAAACKGWDLPADVPVYLFVGRMMWYKGLRISLDALKQLSEEGRDFRMVCIGSGVELPEIKNYAVSIGLSEKVLFIPPVYDREILRAWYCRADLFLFPSTFDTNGLVVREAAACSLPSVLIRGSCAAEDTTDGRNCFHIEEQAASMTALLRKIYGKRELLRQVGEAARNELYLSWEDAVQRACDRYEIVLERFRQGAYPPHKMPSGDMLRIASESIAAINRLYENFMEFQTNLKSEHAKMEERMTDLLSHWIS